MDILLSLWIHLVLICTTLFTITTGITVITVSLGTCNRPNGEISEPLIWLCITFSLYSPSFSSYKVTQANLFFNWITNAKLTDVHILIHMITYTSIIIIVFTNWWAIYLNFKSVLNAYVLNFPDRCQVYWQGDSAQYTSESSASYTM